MKVVYHPKYKKEYSNEQVGKALWPDVQEASTNKHSKGRKTSCQSRVDPQDSSGIENGYYGKYI